MTGPMPANSSTASSSPSIRVQSVLFNLPQEAAERTLLYLDNAALQAIENGTTQAVEVAYGDCSPQRTIDEATLNDWRKRFSNLKTIEYTYFDANLGSAAGHNRLLEKADSDLVMILNPDVLASPTLFIELGRALARPGVGLVEARQIPIEHPKDYDDATGETSWASTACALGPLSVFRQINGFDDKSFFLYCDDVDFSWRVRLAGYKVIHAPSAFIFHDKRLNHEGGWISSSAEKYYSAEGALLLAYKWSRNDLTEEYLRYFTSCGDPILEQVAVSFEARRTTGRLPTPVDTDHQIGQFVKGAYAQHRFDAR